MAKPVTQRIKLYINGKEIDNTLTSIRKNLIRYKAAANKATQGSDDWKKYNKQVAQLEVEYNNARSAQNEFRKSTDLSTAGLKRGQKAVKKYDFSIIGLVSSSMLLTDAIQSGIGYVKEFISDSVTLAEEAKGIEYAFNQITNSAKILEESRKASKGLISDLDIKKATNQFKNFNLDLDQLPTILEFVSVRAAQTGASFENLFSSAIEGLSKESKLRIDNLGISTKDLNTELEKTPNFLEAVANIADREITKAGSILDDAANSQQKWNTSLENAKLRIGNLITKSGVIPFFQKIGSSLLNVVVAQEKHTNAISKEQVGLNTLVSKLLEAKDGTDDRKILMQQLIDKYPFYLKFLKDEKTDNDSLKTALNSVNEMYVKKLALTRVQSKLDEKQREQANKEADLAKNRITFRQNLIKVNQLLYKGSADNLKESLEGTSKALTKAIENDIRILSGYGSNITEVDARRLSRRKSYLSKIREQEQSIIGSTFIKDLASESVNEVKKELQLLEKELGITSDEVNDIFGGDNEVDLGTIGGKKEMTDEDKRIQASKEKLEEWLDQWEADQKIKKQIKDLEEDEAAKLKEELELEAELLKMANDAGHKTLLEAGLVDARKEKLAAIQKKWNDKLLADNKKADEKKLKNKLENDKKYAAIDKESKEKLKIAEENLQASKTKALQFGVYSLKNILGEKSGIYKAMFALEKALAIKEIVINTQKANAQITSNLAVANMKAVAASPLTGGLPFVGINTAIASKETLANNINAGVQVAYIASAAISSLDKGGHTFNGSYSGGMDGIGGQLAMIHPDEYMIPKPVMQMPEVPIIVEYLEAKRTGKPISSLAKGGSASEQPSITEDPSTSSNENNLLAIEIRRLNTHLDKGLKLTYTLQDEVERQKLEDELNNTLKNAKS
tara:strand:+ start:22166 stop:24880 length:2715 start_codon:yes stop_codon:yes gene_type:complete